MQRAVLGILLGVSILVGSFSVLLLTSFLSDPDRSGSYITINDGDGDEQAAPPVPLSDKVRSIVFPAIFLLASILLGIYCDRQLSRNHIQIDSAVRKSGSIPNSYID